MLPFAEQGYKDPMHGNEHGNSMLSVKCSVIKLRNIGEELNLRPDVFIKRLKTRLLGLCDSSSVQHLTNMEVEAAIQLAHDLDETGMPCVCIGVGLLGVLLDLPERI
jgi:hypothetical protein